MNENRAILSIHSKIPNQGHKNPDRYLGVTELVGYGFTIVEVVLPTGVKPFPDCPFMVTLPCENTFVEFRKGTLPLLQVNEWETIQRYYY